MVVAAWRGWRGLGSVAPQQQHTDVDSWPVQGLPVWRWSVRRVRVDGKGGQKSHRSKSRGLLD